MRTGPGRGPALSRQAGLVGGLSETASVHEVWLQLPFQPPLFPDNVFGHLVATAVPGVEEWRDGAYRRTLRLPNGSAIVSLRPRPDYIQCQLLLEDQRDQAAAVARCRWLLDLDADPVVIDAALSRDRLLAPLVWRAPGRRVPRSVDAGEFAIRAVLGQQVSTAAARTHTGRLVVRHGDPIDDPGGELTHLFPTVDALRVLDPASLAFPESRRRSVAALVWVLATGGLDLGAHADRERARERLHALPGVGTWTVEVVAMRALGDPDAFPATDLGVRLAAKKLGLPAGPAALTSRAAAWRPWRAYAVQHLWATGAHPINNMPTA
jgi:AraC family transcriptional regulator, regulatory protein of adaptative response / DNA-3-methyladenine glycosylase II